MKEKIAVTESEILDALRDALQHAPEADDALTTEELTDALGLHTRRVRALIKKMIRTGDAECVTVTRPAMDGRNARVPAYRLKKGPRLLTTAA